MAIRLDRRSFQAAVHTLFPAEKPYSSHVVSVLLEACEEMGIPKFLYTDNDAIIKLSKNQSATQIIGKALEDRGLFKPLEYRVPPKTARRIGPAKT